MNKRKIGLFIALGSTVLSIAGIIVACAASVNVGSTLMSIGVLSGIVSYFFGGFLTALKMAWGIARIGWVMVPFPIDIFTFLFTFIFAILAFFFIPIIPVGRAYRINRI